MLNKVDKVFVGKNIARTVAIVDGADMDLIQANAVEGEVLVLDENFQNAAATVTFADTQTLYIAEGSAEIFNTVNPDGSALSGRRMLLSSPIDGTRVVSYTGGGYQAKAEMTSTIPAITDTIVPGTEYVLRIVYKGDVATMHPGQNLETYRYTAKTGDDSDAVFNGLIARINKYNFNNIRRTNKALISAALVTNSLVLTAKPIVSCTTSVNDIDELVLNSFETRLNYVDSDYNWTEVTLSGDITYTAAFRGYGSWETVRDLEKHAQAYQGVTNRVWFPVIKPAMRTIKNAEYDLINIEHDVQYRSPDNSYNKETSLATVIALENGAAQGTTVLTTLNAWMASLPTPFANVTFA